MKKALTGCLVVALLALVIGGGALWWFVLRPAWNAGSEMVAAAQQWTELVQIEAKIDNQSAFEAPADGVIPGEVLTRFVAVQTQIDARVGDRLALLQSRYEAIEAQQGQDGKEPGLQALLGAYGDLFGLLKEAKQSQVDALNAQRMSLDEYRWTRNRAYAALGLDAAALGTTSPTDASNANATALQPHRELLVRTLATAWLDF